VRQPTSRDLAGIARANALVAATGDGNDVVGVHVVAREAVERARGGGGPSLLEFHTYRWYEHCGPYFDQHFPLRGEDTLAAWKRRDPLVVLQRRLLDDGLLDESELEAIDLATLAEVDEAERFARESPFPAPETFATDIYGT
jgi:TPP-dependent pyruvate/acetoin dehydrogenase alpha subunit